MSPPRSWPWAVGCRSGSGWSARSRAAARPTDLDARGSDGRMTGRGGRGSAGIPIRWGSAGRTGSALISLSPPRREDQVGWEGLRFGFAIQWRAVYAARDLAAPAGAKGWLVVSLYQIASSSR